MRRLAAFALLVPILLIGSPAAAADDPGRGDQWALDRIGAAAARGRGEGVVVAVLDSGVDLAHVDLRDRVLPGYDFVDDDDVAQDANGHGTHVAGIIAASAGNGAGVQGVAPAAKILPVRVLDADGSGTSDDVVAGIRWAIERGANVINLSIAEDTQAVFGPALSDALSEAWAAGVVPVIAAGNQYVLGSGFADQPALVVAATTRSDQKPSYSSSVGAAKWGISAPGGEQPMLDQSAAILSTFWIEGMTDQYAYDAGTSMAAPHVSGAVAILLGLGMSPQQAVDRVLATATDIGANGRDDTFGAGRLDLAAATASDGDDPENETPAPAPAPGSSPSTPTTAAPAGSTTPTSAGGGAGATTPPTAADSPSIPTVTTGTPSSTVPFKPPADLSEKTDDGNKTIPAVGAGIALLGSLYFGVLAFRRSP